MKITFVKKELKESLATIKRVFAKDKENAKVFVQADEKGVMMQSSTKKIITFHALTKLDEEEFSFSTSPIEFEKLLKGKGIHIEFELEKDKLVSESGDIKVESFEKKMGINFKELTDFKDKDTFLSILKEAESVLCETTQACTSYLKIGPKKAMAAEPKRIHFYRLDEDFPFSEGFIHKEAVSVLAKSINAKSTLTYGMYGNALVLCENEKNYFLLNMEQNVLFPSLRAMKPVRIAHSFTVNAEEVNAFLKNYGAKVKELSFKRKGDSLILNPRNQEFETYAVTIQSAEGQFLESLFDAPAIKGLFMGYSEDVKVEHYEYINIYGDKGYMWRITTPLKITMAAGVTEPDWDAITVKKA